MCFGPWACPLPWPTVLSGVSLHHYNTEEEIDFVIAKLPPIIERLRSLSPYWREEKVSATEGSAG